jgi:hypothetical protein
MKIRSFETEFMQAHGHLPKGVDRTPLRATYVQYRRLKQGVRGTVSGEALSFPPTLPHAPSPSLSHSLPAHSPCHACS